MLKAVRRNDVIIAVVAIAAALAASAATGRLSTPDRWEYSVTATHLLNGEGAFYEYMGTRYYFYGQPLYPLLLAGAIKLTGGELVVVLFQTLLVAATAVVCYRMALPLWGERAALMGGLLVALHPGGLIYAGRLHSQALDVFIITLGFALWLRVRADTSSARALATGGVLGFSMIARGTMGPAIAAWLLHFVWHHRIVWPKALMRGFVVGVGVLLVLAPIAVRGYRMYGELIPLRTDSGVNLWYGNHEGSGGTSYTPGANPVPIVAHLSREDIDTASMMNEVEQNEYFTAKAVEFWKTQPGEATRLFAKKMFYYWWASPHTGILYPATWTRVYLVYYAGVLVFGGIGLWRALFRQSPASRDAATAFLLMALFVSVTQAAFYVEGRHRWQLEPIMLLFAASGVMAALSGRASATRAEDPRPS